MSKTIITVLTTIPTLRENYLGQTLRSLDANGANECDHKVIVSDGPCPPAEMDGWDVSINRKEVGKYNFFANTLRIARERDADFLIHCEDDIVCAKDAVGRMLRHQHQLGDGHWAFINYFDRVLPQGAHPCWWSLRLLGEGHPERFFAGTQCLMLPRRTIDFLLTQTIPNPPVYPWDVLFSRLLYFNSPWKHYGVLVPGLIDHVGIKSGRVLSGNNFEGISPPLAPSLHRT